METRLAVGFDLRKVPVPNLRCGVGPRGEMWFTKR